MDYNFIWIIGICSLFLIGFCIYKYNKDKEFFIKIVKYKIYILIFITWIYRLFVDFHHKCAWQRYLKYINKNPSYLVLNIENKTQILDKQKQMKKYFWFFQKNYMKRLDKNVWIMKFELESYRYKMKNTESVSLNSFMKIHKNYRDIVNASDDDFIPMFIEFLSCKQFDYIEKIEVISSGYNDQDILDGSEKIN